MPRRGTSSKASVNRCFYVELYFDTAACMLLPSLFTFFPPIFAHAIINLKRDYHENTKISHFSHPSHASSPSLQISPRTLRPPSNQRQWKRTGVSRLCVAPALREEKTSSLHKFPVFPLFPIVPTLPLHPIRASRAARKTRAARASRAPRTSTTFNWKLKTENSKLKTENS